MPNQCSEEFVKFEFDRVLKEVQESARLQISKYTGIITDVLVEEENSNDNSLVTGRMSNNTIVHFKGDKSLIGTIVNVRLLECKGFYYMGELVDERS